PGFIPWGRILRLLALLGALVMPAISVAAEELRIITSYPTDVVNPMLEAFQTRHPGIHVRTLNKNTPAAVDEILGGNERRFDLSWASALEAFVVLKNAGRLVSLGHGPHAEFAWSAVGWT